MDKKLTIKRASLKRQLTNFLNYTKACEREIPQLRERYERAPSIWREFEEVHQEIEYTLFEGGNQQAIEEHIQNKEKYEQIYYEALGIAREKLQVLNIQQENSTSMPQTQSQAQTGTNANYQGESVLKLKLPPLTIQPFQGEYDKWLTFKDAFTQGVHNKNIPAIQKFQLLQGLLKDKALKVIAALEASEANYEIAWELLRKRYENTRLIINTHMKGLFELTPITKSNHVSLRNMVDEIRTHTRSLQALRLPVEHWDMVIIYLSTNKFDNATREEWEKEISSNPTDQMPTLEEMMSFLEKRCLMLEMTDKGKSQAETTTTGKKTDKKVMLAAAASTCPHCGSSHLIFQCEKFLKLSPQERYVEVRQKRLCTNCFKTGHRGKDCRGSSCRKCNLKHNTLLHKDQDRETITEKKSHEGSKEEAVTAVHHSQSIGGEVQRRERGDQILSNNKGYQIMSNCVPEHTTRVILSTALVYVTDVDGDKHKCRALLDPGSQSNMITEELVNKLKVPCKEIRMPISGVNKARFTINKSARIQLTSTTSGFTVEQEYLVLPVITEHLPQVRLDKSKLLIPRHIVLADPEFEAPGPVDVLIGAGLFWKILKSGRAILRRNQPALQNTYLGWIVGGEQTIKESQQAISACHFITTQELDNKIEKFWQTEEIGIQHARKREDEFCERHFKETHIRDEEGRFQVRLPINQEIILGDSHDNALRRLYSIERRFKRQPELKQEYVKFMEDYERSGHMSLHRGESTELCFLPHQPVLRETSLTTKLRVVFDASAKTSSGASLNDKLLVGPNLQKDIVEILIRFRCHEYVLTADITQMFRQIKIAEEDRYLQCILWRSDVEQPVRIYTLNTVTYGTSCAPFLAMKCLEELAEQGRETTLRAADVLNNDSYMDDIITGTRTPAEAIELQRELTKLLSSAQFPLRKWRTNDPTILESLTESGKTEELLIIDSQESIKTLGLLWNSSKDVLQYKISLPELTRITKRRILSVIAQFYDPLGIIGPVIMSAKLIMQRLWKLNIGWDEEVPNELGSTWEILYNSLDQLGDLAIKRNVNPKNPSQSISLHGFCDASEKGYGACIYVLSRNESGELQSNLLCSKSRVAPLKTLTLPRLELNAALLLSRLISVVKRALRVEIESIHLWSDSTITLCWINTPPSNLRTFVANRVAEIQELTDTTWWYYVPSGDNPADIISRGMSLERLLLQNKWWNGPSWLRSKSEWPTQNRELPEEIPEQKRLVMVSALKQSEAEDLSLQRNKLLRKFSSISKLQRVIAYCFRFADRKLRRTGPISVEELDRALNKIIQWTQEEVFPKEIADLRKEKTVHNKSALIGLRPFMDKTGLMRVGGRLSNARISKEQKHPIILPAKNHITETLLREEHIRLLHCGPQQLLSSIRNKYWPLSGTREVRKVTRKCVPCFRYKPKTQEHLMADLPESRVNTFSKPFEISGVDYAGPLQVRESRRRGRIRRSKGYIAVFTCFATKAVHLELVSDLTTETFLAALRRFVARRGLCSTIYSDNATNFVGAARELEDIYKFLEAHHSELLTTLAAQRINWQFLPPRSPHFGGLWEAAVKSVKRHLYTITKGLSYTFEEYSTLLAEIESVLNSRPLMPVPSDPNEISTLTPSHFLIGKPSSEPVAKNYLETPDNRLARWQHIQKLKQHFWQRWQKEYLHHFQSRTKWHTGSENLRVGTIVLLVDENQAPLQWTLGRVLKVYPGADNIVRVADVKTSKGQFRRSVKKLCALPYEH